MVRLPNARKLADSRASAGGAVSHVLQRVDRGAAIAKESALQRGFSNRLEPESETGERLKPRREARLEAGWGSKTAASVHALKHVANSWAG